MPDYPPILPPDTAEKAVAQWHEGRKAYFGSHTDPRLVEVAYQFLKSAAGGLEEFGVLLELSKTLRMLTVVCGTLSRPEEAEACMRRAIACIKEVKTPEGEEWLMKAYLDLAQNGATVEERLEGVSEARTLIKKLQKREPKKAEWVRYEALIWRAEGMALARRRPKTVEDLRASAEALEKSVALLAAGGGRSEKVRASRAKALVGLARSRRALYLLARDSAHLSAAEAAAVAAGAEFEAMGSPHCWASFHLAKVRMEQGREKEALEHCRRAADLAEEDRKAFDGEETRLFHWADKVALFDYGIYVAHKLGDYATAFDLAQRCKARVFLERTERNGDAIRPVPLSELQARLAPGEALVEYHCGKHALTMFALTRDGVQVARPEQTRESLEEFVASVRGFMSRTAVTSAASERFCRETLREAGRVLIDPLWKTLKDACRVTVVPSGPLFHLPWGALVTPDEQWAAQRWEVSSLPHAALTGAAGPADGVRRVVVLADPTLDLPYADQEAGDIKDIYKDALVSRGEKVSRQALARLAEPTLLHIACHGYLDAAAPKLSYLDFGRDGKLTVEDINALDLKQVRLAFLSCCQTGLGKIWRGDELEGLSRAFLAAGARRAIVSLWEVGDAATGALVKRFYAKLSQGQAPAQALRSAQVEVMAEPGFAHPYHWAGFIPVG